jgi:hypothetical protein
MSNPRVASQLFQSAPNMKWSLPNSAMILIYKLPMEQLQLSRDGKISIAPRQPYKNTKL